MHQSPLLPNHFPPHVSLPLVPRNQPSQLRVLLHLYHLQYRLALLALFQALLLALLLLLTLLSLPLEPLLLFVISLPAA